MRQPLFSVIGGVLVLALLALAAGHAAAEVDEVERQDLTLKLGGSDLFRTDQPFNRISVANPNIADVVVISPRQLYVYGKEVGSTSIILWEGERGTSFIDVVVTFDLVGLKQQLHEQFPGQDINVYASETGVVLSGTVTGPEVVEEALRLTSMFLPKDADSGGQGTGSGRSTHNITNLLRVAGAQQVMLEVKFAEITRNSGRDLQAGMALDSIDGDQRWGLGTGALGVGPDGDSAQAMGSLLMNLVGNTVETAGPNLSNIFVNIDHFTAALQFLESEGLARMLAEPRLVTISGQEASFLAGGEFPIPVPQPDGNFTIEFKEFGVGLSFTPIVQSNGKISLRVAPSVSEITEFREAAGGQFPQLTTRNLQTNVELHEGQTLALAGLLQDNLSEQMRKIPGLGDIPILGALFRSSHYSQQKTDLLVAVTPRLVSPVAAGSLQFPGQDMRPPNRYEFYLEGRLEGRRSANTDATDRDQDFTQPPAAEQDEGGLEGEFGHRPPRGQNSDGN